jgi:hypothetical protein
VGKKKGPRLSCLLLSWFFIFFSCSDSGDNSVAPERDESSETASAGNLASQTIRQLESLGYFDRAPTADPAKRSVTKAEPKAFDGLNLYNSRRRAEAYLIDNDGKVLHKWSAKTERPTWMHTELQPNGDLLALSKLVYVARYDWNSKLLWRRKMTAHHDLAIGLDENLFVLTSSIQRYDYSGARIPVLDNSITMISEAGKFRGATQLFPLLGDFISERRLKKIKSWAAKGYTKQDMFRENRSTDVFHTNSIQIISKPIPSIAEAGSFLLSVREVNRIVIIDESMTRLLWSWGAGELEEQHHATLLNNGNIMVFDNGVLRKQSRVIEVNPITKEIEWSYTAPGFFTRLRGSAQKLENGNVLITESDKGHAFEVTPSGKIVWEFWNPDVVEDSGKSTRGVIYRMTRYEKNYLEERLLDS